MVVHSSGPTSLFSYWTSNSRWSQWLITWSRHIHSSRRIVPKIQTDQFNHSVLHAKNCACRKPNDNLPTLSGSSVSIIYWAARRENLWVLRRRQERLWIPRSIWIWNVLGTCAHLGFGKKAKAHCFIEEVQASRDCCTSSSTQETTKIQERTQRSSTVNLYLYACTSCRVAGYPFYYWPSRICPPICEFCAADKIDYRNERLGLPRQTRLQTLEEIRPRRVPKSKVCFYPEALVANQ